jgi:release factor glutamine methyltransferase
VNDLLREAAERLRVAGIESARAEARILSEHAQKLSLCSTGGEGWGEGDQLQQLAHIPPHSNPLFPRMRADSLFGQLLQRRLAHEPVAYITGHKEFWSLDFEVGSGALIPRPETETLVEQALREVPDRKGDNRILDLGTGTGCLLIALLKEFSNATGVGIDSSEAALQWARRNRSRHRLESRCTLVEGAWDLAEDGFDVIVSNPPYIPSGDLAGLAPDIRDYEPELALDGGPDGLAAYRALAPVLKRCLKPKGVALLEMGAGQAHMVEVIVGAVGLGIGESAPDLAGTPRCAVVRQV